MKCIFVSRRRKGAFGELLGLIALPTKTTAERVAAGRSEFSTAKMDFFVSKCNAYLRAGHLEHLPSGKLFRQEVFAVWVANYIYHLPSLG